MIMERMQAFTSGKYEGGTTGDEILADYDAKRGDAIEQVEALSITRRIASTGLSLSTQGYSSQLLTYNPS